MIAQLKQIVARSADFGSRVFLDPLFPAEKVDPSLAAELRQAFSQMPPEDVKSDSRVESEWDELRRGLRAQFGASPESFLRRTPARGLLGLSNSRTAVAAYRFLCASSQWERYRAVLNEDATGRPYRFWPLPRTSGGQVHHTFHLANFETQTGASVDSMRLVTEFGGGFGGLCRQVHRLGFKGKYVIIDLPELSAVQRYFLQSVGLKVLSREEWLRPDSPGICLATSQSDLRDLVSGLRADYSPSLFVATWSLSEVPRQLRDEILGIVGQSDHFLIAYQTHFGSVPNPEFFAEMMAQRGGPHVWKHIPIYGNPSSFYVLK